MAGKVAKRLTVEARSRRVARLKKALAKAKARGELTPNQLAALMEVTPQRFASARRTIEGLPEPRVDEKGRHHYPARATIQALIAHYDRPDTKTRAEKKTVARMIGSGSEPGEPSGKELLDPLGYQRLVTAHGVATEQAQRQLRLTETDKVRAVVGGLYMLMARTLSSLPNKVDPAGKLPLEQRQRLEQASRDAQIALHREAKAFLEASGAA